MSSESKDLYKILGVGEGASDAEIKKAYRSLSLKYHPDRNATEDAAAKIREINDAYEILSDAQQRRQYDAESHGGFTHMNSMDDMGDINNLFKMMFGQAGMAGMGGFPGQGGGAGGMGGGPEIRIFHGGFPGGFPGSGFPGAGGMPFGNPGFMHQMQKPPPIIQTIRLSLEESYQGCTKPVEIEKWVLTGDIKVQEIETVYVTIPAGIDNNEILIMRDRGNTVHENCRGDLKFIFQVEGTSEAGLQRHGVDLVYRKSISLKEALCGFSFDIKHLNGKGLCLNNMTNPTIIRPNFKKVIPGLGMNRDGNCGNLVIEFAVDFPESLTAEQIASIGQAL